MLEFRKRSYLGDGPQIIKAPQPTGIRLPSYRRQHSREWSSRSYPRRTQCPVDRARVHEGLSRKAADDWARQVAHRGGIRKQAGEASVAVLFSQRLIALASHRLECVEFMNFDHAAGITDGADGLDLDSDFGD